MFKKNIKKITDYTRKTLIKAQKITGFDNIYFFKGGFWMVFAQIIFILAGIIVSVAFTRLGDKALFGKYQFILSLVATITVFTLPGSGPALTQSVTRGFEKTFTIIMKQRTRWSLLGTIGLIAASGYFYFIKHDMPFAIALLIAAIAFPKTFGTSTVNSFWLGKGDFAKANEWLIKERIVTSLGVTAMLLITAFLIKTENVRFILIIATYYAMTFIVNTISIVKLRKRRLAGGADYDALRYGKHITALQIIPRIFGQIDRLLIPVFIGVEALAVYVISVIIPDTLKSFLNMMHTVAFKKLVTLPEEQILVKLRKAWLIMFFVIILAATIIGIPFAIRLLYGHAYEQSILLAQIYACMLPVSFVFDTFTTWLLAQKKEKEYFWFVNGYNVINAVAVAGTLLIVPRLEWVIISRVAVIGLFAVLTIAYLSISAGKNISKRHALV